MPFLTDTEIDKRIQSPDNLMNRLTVHEIVGSNKGSVKTPIEIKKVAAILHQEEGSVREIGRQLGLSRSTVHNASNGLTSEGNPNHELKQVVAKVKSEKEQNRESAESAAVDLLLTSLQILPKALSSESKAKNISSVAKDMAAIANMMGNVNDKDGKGERTMHLHLYAPKMKTTEDYEVIDVGVE